ncbi:hypothetical protein TKK_0005346 [Trichogramma kaykai]|uniref:BTB domain-containing protein n=1 Tax=Trichogramma kaykai TaxID=54128 RepID=A0ABD2XII3_9HYME
MKIISPKGLITVHFSIDTAKHYKENSLTLYSESSIETLYNNPDLSDVQLRVEKVKFYAHKAVLANFSPVFLAMFKNDMKEAKENVVEINDVSAEVVDNLLKIICSGKANINESTMYDLSYASKKYQINNLKSLCANYLYDSLTIENCVDIASLAEKRCMNQLKYKVIIVIAHNYNLDCKNSSFY